MTTRDAKLRINLEGNAASELRRLSENVRRVRTSGGEAERGLKRVEGATKRANREASRGVSAWGRAARAVSSANRAEGLFAATTNRVASALARSERGLTNRARRISDNVRRTRELTRETEKLTRAERLAERARRSSWASTMGRGGGARSRASSGGGGFGSGLVSGLGRIPGLGILGVAGGGAAAAGMAVAGGAIAGVTALAGAMAIATREASRLDTAMSRVRAVSMGSRRDMAVMRGQAAELGASTIYTASEVGAVQENLLRAGFSTEQTRNAVPAALSYATASGTDTGFAATAIAQTVRALGFEAEQSRDVADVFTVAGASANVDASTLSETLKYAAPVFAAMGKGEQRTALEDVTALAGILGDKGIQGSMAGTALRAGYAALSAPTGAAGKALRGLNVKTQDTEGNVRRLPEILADMRDALQGRGTAEQQKALSSIFGTRNAGVFAAILDTSPDRFDALVRGMRDAEDAADRTARIMSDNLGGDLTALGSVASGLATELGSSLMPGVRNSTQSFTDFTTAIHRASEASGVGAAVFGKAGSAMEFITDGFIDFASKVAPRVARALEAFGVIEEGGAEKFATEMANAMTDVRKERAESRAQRELDQVTNEARLDRQRLLGARGAVGAAQGTTGQALAREMSRSLKDAGLEDLIDNPEIAAILADAEGQGQFSKGRKGDAERQAIRQRMQEAIAPHVDDRLAASERTAEERASRIRETAEETVSGIEATRGAAQEDAVAQASMSTIIRSLIANAGPAGWALNAIGALGETERSGAGEKQAEILRRQEQLQSEMNENMRRMADQGASTGRASNGAD